MEDIENETESLPNEDVVEQRRQFLNSMKSFVDKQKSALETLLRKLGLSYEEIMKSEPRMVCPFNSEHVVPESVFQRHMESCKLLTAGYQKDELEPLLQDSDFWYKDCDKIMKVQIDENQLNKIIWDHCVQNGQVYTGHRTMPVSHIDENRLLTQEDRLAVYRHVVSTSREANKVLSVDKDDEQLTTDWGALVKKGLLDEQSNKQYSSKLEQLAALRDMKRRRQSYRAKNVHITKKSYTEIIREVIVNQMEILKPPEESPHPWPHKVDDIKKESQDDRVSDRGGYSRKYRGQESSPRRRDRSGRTADDKERDRSPWSHRRGGEDRHPNERRFRERSSDDFEVGRRDRGDDRSRSRHDREYSKSSRSNGRFTADIEVKQEVLSDDNLDETWSRNDRSDNKERRKRDRSVSEDSSDSDGGKHRHKHKKSKHKKKHSKKHKKKD